MSQAHHLHRARVIQHHNVTTSHVNMIHVLLCSLVSRVRMYEEIVPVIDKLIASLYDVLQVNDVEVSDVMHEFQSSCLLCYVCYVVWQLWYVIWDRHCADVMLVHSSCCSFSPRCK